MMPRRLGISFLFVWAAMSGLAVRLFYLQVFQGFNYSELSQKRSHIKIKSETFRGTILDRNGNVLATSVEGYSVFLHPKQFVKSLRAIKLLETNLSLYPGEVKEKCLSGQDFVWLSRKSSAASVENISREKIEGVGVINEQVRYYPNGSLAAQLVGFSGLDNYGLSGIEQSQDKYLKGNRIELEQLHDAKGRNIFTAQSNAVKSSGNSVVLTLDRTLQYIAERELKSGIAEYEAKSGIVIIQNPTTGEILAMASIPSFDPNPLAQGARTHNLKPDALQNPAISKIFEPGSTFKAITFATALEEKRARITEKYDCENGKWKYYDRIINDHEPESIATFSEVLEKSSNIGTAKISLGIGEELFFRYVRAFGFGARTWIALPGEAEGLVRPLEKWSKVSLPSMSFGQEIGVTALQLINAYSAIANGGLLMEPLIVKELREPDGGHKVKEAYKSQIVRRVISTQTASAMRRLLLGVVDRGTGINAQIPGYTVAGKTGTAQKINPDTKRYYADKYTSSFCGFLPAESPQLVCLVVLDEPKQNYWGGSSAAPVFAKVMSRAAQIYGIAPKSANNLTIVKLNKSNDPE